MINSDEQKFCHLAINPIEEQQGNISTQLDFKIWGLLN